MSITLLYCDIIKLYHYLVSCISPALVIRNSFWGVCTLSAWPGPFLCTSLLVLYGIPILVFFFPHHGPETKTLLQKPMFPFLGKWHLVTDISLCVHCYWDFIAARSSSFIHKWRKYIVCIYLHFQIHLNFSTDFFFFFYFWTLQYWIGFAIYQNEFATGINAFPILNPPLSSLPIPSLWVIPVHQPQASYLFL